MRPWSFFVVQFVERPDPTRMQLRIPHATPARLKGDRHERHGSDHPNRLARPGCIAAAPCGVTRDANREKHCGQRIVEFAIASESTHSNILSHRHRIGKREFEIMNPFHQARNPRQCMKLCFEYLTGKSWSNGTPLGTVEPLEWIKSTFFTRPQALVLLCYLQIVEHKSPGLYLKVDQCRDAIGCYPEDRIACRAWASSIVEKLARCSLEDIFRNPPVGLQRAIVQWVGQYNAVMRRTPKTLRGLQREEFRYPGEGGLLQTVLDVVPGLKWQLSIASQASTAAVATVEMVRFRLNAVEVTPRNIPQIARSWDRACSALAIQTPMPLYLSSNRAALGTVGISSPVVVIPTMVASMFDEDELVFLLGRELGKILCDHQRLLGLVETLQDGADQVGVGILAKLFSTLTFDQWRRAAQLTCDRAGVLACQSPEIADRVFLKWMGYPIRYARQMPAWVLREMVAERAQYCQQSNVTSMADQAIAWAGTVTGPSLPLLTRAALLQDWVDSGEFAEVMKRNKKRAARQELKEIIAPRAKGHFTNDMLLATLRKSESK